MSTTKRKPIHYVDNQKFHREIVEFRKALEEARRLGNEEPRIPDYIGECICKIAQRLSMRPSFMNYSFRDEMISDGIENSILYFKDYNPEIGQNPFAYFTQVIYYAFLRRIAKEEKNRYTLYKSFQELISTHDVGLFVDSDDNHLIPTKLYDNIHAFMEKFEKKENFKKEKRKQMKSGLENFYKEE
jgi:hypothetical protein